MEGKERVRKIVDAIAETIKESGQITLGALYNPAKSLLTLKQYKIILGALRRAGFITVEGSLVTWNGLEWKGGDN